MQSLMRYVMLYAMGRDSDEHEQRCRTTLDLHEFGNELPFASLEEVPDQQLELILEFKDRLMRLLGVPSGQ